MFQESKPMASMTQTVRPAASAAAPSVPLAERIALFVDFDGTLVEFAPTPDSVTVDNALRILLRRLSNAVGGALAVISGRPLASIDALLQLPQLAVIGQHGAEFRHADGHADRPPLSASALDKVRVDLRPLAAERPDVRVEDKGLAIAFHYREMPRAEPQARELAAAALRLAGPGFELLHGNCVIELKSIRVDKGRALAAMMLEPPFTGREPWMIGDDHTDEPAFATAQALGGTGVIVGTTRPSVAHAALPDVAAARKWLADLTNRPRSSYMRLESETAQQALRIDSPLP
jgi:trehalose 6-phosphate phosphatase